MSKRRHRKHAITKAIKTRTSQRSPNAFLWSAISAMSVSLALRLIKRKPLAMFVGQWVAPILLLGVYNKLTKSGTCSRRKVFAKH